MVFIVNKSGCVSLAEISLYNFAEFLRGMFAKWLETTSRLYEMLSFRWNSLCCDLITYNYKLYDDNENKK